MVWIRREVIFRGRRVLVVRQAARVNSRDVLSVLWDWEVGYGGVDIFARRGEGEARKVRNCDPD